MENEKDRFTWHKGDATMYIDGKPGRFVNGKFVPDKEPKKKKKK